MGAFPSSSFLSSARGKGREKMELRIILQRDEEEEGLEKKKGRRGLAGHLILIPHFCFHFGAFRKKILGGGRGGEKRRRRN